jgi:uncharacterized protein YndB with AHSA1/START domain
MSKNNLQIDRENKKTTMERVIDAPRELVWKAHLDAELIPKWWGPRKYKTVVEKLEPKVGGQWRFTNEADGEKYVFFGEYKELVEPEKITWTFSYEPYADSVITETIHFETVEGNKTKLKVESHYPTAEALEGMVSSGMEEGATETWDRLEELVATMK